jgi:biotin carboxyl carrier protein
LKLRVELDGEDYTLDLQPNGANSEYTLRGAKTASGVASIAQVMPGVFSVLLRTQSFAVYVIPKSEEVEVWVGSQCHTLAITDVRDRSATRKKISAAGPMEIRAQMPGRVIKLLAELNAKIQAGHGVIVVEAMKMQNEMKSPKDGIVSKILVSEGATVAAGETLVVIE